MKIQAGDFELLIELYEKHCKGYDINFDIDMSGNLNVRMRNVYDEEFEIVVYAYTGAKHGYIPTVRTKDRLTNFLARKRRNSNAD
jgi:hypothetical protein